MQLSEIREIEIRSKLTGVDQTTAGLRTLATAEEAVVQSSERFERSTRSVTSALERHQRSLDTDYASMIRLERVTQDLGDAQARGLISLDRHNQLLTLANQRYGQVATAVKGAGTATKLASHEITMMSAQFIDLGTQIASGGGLFLPIIQQGGQLAGQLGDRGAKGALKALGQGLIEFATNPVNLAVVGVAALGAGIQYYLNSAQDDVSSMETVLEKHTATIRLIRDAWGEAGKAVEEYSAPSRIRASAETQSDRMRLQAASLAQGKTAIGSLFSSATDMTGEDLFAVNPGFQRISKEVEAFRQSVVAGKPDFTSLLDTVDQLYLSKPGDSVIEALRKKVHELAEEGEKAQRALGPLTGLGGSHPLLDAYLKQSSERGNEWLEEKFRRDQAASIATEEFGFGMRDASATTAAARAGLAADRARASATRDGGDPDLAASRASAIVLEQARQEERRYRDEQAEGRRRSIEGAQAELQSVGATAMETDRLRKTIELTNEARQRAYQLTGDYNKADLSSVQKEAELHARVAQSIREVSAAQDAVRETSMLSLSPDERSIRSRFETDDAGEIISAKDRMTAAQLRYNKAVTDAQEAERGLGQELLDAAKKGDWKGALGAITDRVEGYFTKQIGDQFDNALSSMIPGLFGAAPMGASDVRAMTASAVSITAATVTVNGGLGSTGLSGGLLNDNAAGGYSGLLKSNPVSSARSTMAWGAPTATTAQALGDSEWLKYLNAGATRSQPIDPKLANAMSFLKDRGISMEVFSGGQSALGTGGPRTGSTRHDNGLAADVFFSQNGRRLDWRNQGDVPVYQDIVRQARANGVTGFGAGPGYMQPGSMHVGYGSPGVWGAGGRGANAPGWLRDAYAAPAPRSMATPLPQIDVVGRSLDTLAQTSAASATAVGGLGQQAGAGANIFQNLFSTLGAAPAVGAPAAGGGGASILGSIFSGIGSLFGFADGGYTGGREGNVAGVVHGAEFVAHAEATRRWRPMLEAMNAGRDPRIMTPVPVPMASGGGGTKVETHFHNAPPVESEERSTDERGNERLDIVFAKQTRKALTTAGSPAQQAMSSTYGAKPKVAKR